MTQDEEFFAWLDGELEGEQAARVAARVAETPELAARAEQHRRLTADIRGAFAPVLEANVPPPRFEAEVVDFGARARERDARRSWFGAPQWAAMAATLALGLVVGNTLADNRSVSPITAEGGQLIAAASLDEALDTRLASAPADTGARIGLSYRDSSGKVCRSFVDGAASGVACREGEEWRIRGLFQSAEGQSSEYRMAAGQDPRLAELVSSTIAGEPFDAEQEKAAQANGWR